MKEEEMNALDRDYQERAEMEGIKLGIVVPEEVDLESIPKHLHIFKKTPEDQRSRGARAAEYVLSGPGNAASVLKNFVPIGEIPPYDMVEEIHRQMDEFHSGETKGIEGILIGQILALNAMFADFARQASDIGHLEMKAVYTRMAFKAQNQSRASIETLSNIKNPRQTVITNQANISNGPQQVNNTLARDSNADGKTLKKLELEQNKLLKHDKAKGKRMVGRAKGAASGDDTTVETVDEINRPANRRRKGKSSS